MLLKLSCITPSTPIIHTLSNKLARKTTKQEMVYILIHIKAKNTGSRRHHLKQHKLTQTYTNLSFVGSLSLKVIYKIIKCLETLFLCRTKLFQTTIFLLCLIFCQTKFVMSLPLLFGIHTITYLFPPKVKN